MKTIKEFAEYMRISEITARRWIAKGTVKTIKIEGSVRITEEEIERLKKVGREDS